MKGRLRAALLLAGIPGIVGIVLSRLPAAEHLERYGFDVMAAARGTRPVPPVCVVALDDASALELGVPQGLPWPRSLHARLIRTLHGEGVRGIAFDVLFDEPRDPVADADLAAALGSTGIVVLGAAVEQVDDPRFRSVRRVEPIPEFAAAAAEVGEVGLPTDRDGVIRQAWLAQEGRPSLARAAFEVATGDRSHAGEASARAIAYYGGPRTIPTVSLYQALAPAEHLPPGFFRGRIAFVGLSNPVAPGETAKDAFLTPFRGRDGATTYGVEIHATIAGNLLDGSRITLLPPGLEGALLLALPLAASLAFLALGPVRGGAAFLLSLAAPWAVGTALFSARGLWLPVVIPSAVQMPLAYGLSLLWYYRTTVRDRERIRRAFSFYLSPEMIRRVTDHPEALHLGGEEIVATAMFTDIKGFTRIAEARTAPQTATLLNTYFSEVTARIFETEGTLIKFIGDAVFAIWGAPLPQEDHARRACLAALALARLDGQVRVVTRIGVHTGPMLVGNLGSSQRFDYTAIGDAVNLAARLEGLNKAFGTVALASGPAVAAAGDGLVTRGLGRVRVAGRAEPVEVFELLGAEGDAVVPAGPERAAFAGALRAFSEGRFAEAAPLFRAVLARLPGDGPSAFYAARAETLATEPPADWDGVVSFVEK